MFSTEAHVVLMGTSDLNLKHATFERRVLCQWHSNIRIREDNLLAQVLALGTEKRTG